MGAMFLLIANYGNLRMAGSGMSPTLTDRERLIYYKRVDWQAIKPGALILFANAPASTWGKPGWRVVSRILAGPGDRLSMDGDHYIVNGAAASAVAGIGNSAVCIDVPASPETIVVPENCYFVVQDAPSRGFDSRVLSWVHKDRILADKIWHVGGPFVFRHAK